jgi:hypothetical protein
MPIRQHNDKEKMILHGVTKTTIVRVVPVPRKVRANILDATNILVSFSLLTADNVQASEQQAYLVAIKRPLASEVPSSWWIATYAVRCGAIAPDQSTSLTVFLQSARRQMKTAIQFWGQYLDFGNIGKRKSTGPADDSCIANNSRQSRTSPANEQNIQVNTCVNCNIDQ